MTGTTGIPDPVYAHKSVEQLTKTVDPVYRNDNDFPDDHAKPAYFFDEDLEDVSRLDDYGLFQVVDLRHTDIPGLGGRGKYCGSHRIKMMSEDGRAVRVRRYMCRRVSCPDCWNDWKRRRVFDIVLRIWAYKLVNDVEVYSWVCSVDPQSVQDWSWGDVNNRLFRKGYRDARKSGMEGGYSLYHPARAKDRVKKKLYLLGITDSNVEDSIKIWKAIRSDVLDLGDWRKYVDFGPHTHNIGFGSPTEHSDPDFILAFREDGDSKPAVMDLDDVVKYSLYLLSHVGVMNDQESHATRSWGCLFDFDPHEALGTDQYVELCSIIAEKLGMVYSPEDDDIGYPFREDDGEDFDWVDLTYDTLYDFLADVTWTRLLDEDQIEFWKSVLKRLDNEGYYEVGENDIPSSIIIIGEVIPNDKGPP
jgi:hypothetical protein